MSRNVLSWLKVGQRLASSWPEVRYYLSSGQAQGPVGGLNAGTGKELGLGSRSCDIYPNFVTFG